MTGSYLGRVLHFAFRRFVFRTDAMEIIVAAFLPAAFKHLGVPMPADTPNNVLAYIAYAALALVVIRLVAAPYFIWKEDQSVIEKLTENLGRPEQLAKAIMAQKLIDYRIDLAERLIGVKYAFLQWNTNDLSNRVNGSLTRTAKIEEHFMAEKQFRELWADFVLELNEFQAHHDAGNEYWEKLNRLIAFLQMQHN